jgi:hypothetical protein
MKKSSLLSRTLWLFGLTLAALTGCGSSVHSGNGVRSGGGEAGATFDFLIYDINGTTPLRCADVDAYTVTTVLTNVSTQKVYRDEFNCDDIYYAGTIPAVPVGNYTLSYELHAMNPIGGVTLLDQTVPGTLYLGPGITPLEGVDFQVNSFNAAWTIYRGGVAAGCSQVGGSQVRLDVVYPGQASPTPYYFPCNELEGTTMAIPMGPYLVSWRMHLLNSAGSSIASTQSATFQVTWDQLANLPSVAFSL